MKLDFDSLFERSRIEQIEIPNMKVAKGRYTPPRRQILFKLSTWRSILL